MKIKIGNGFDVHAFGEGTELTLAGITIPHSHCLIAHSDGDVVIHALCDALLGALALGDIGKHFPDTDPLFKNIDSKILLAKTNELVKAKGYSISNVDCTILAEAPKIQPHVGNMRKCLAQILDLDIDDVSVKATTTEKLGFVGRKEGVATIATALLIKE